MTRAPLVAWILPLVFTGVAVSMAAINRQGSREAMALTEREATMTTPGDESSAAALWMVWHDAPFADDSWFDCERLEEIGFDCSVPAEHAGAEAHYRRQLPRPGFAALELGGQAWEALVAEGGITNPNGPTPSSNSEAPGVEREPVRPVEGPRPRMDRETSSRLVVVDVATDADELARRYPDGRTHLITAAVFGIARGLRADDRPFVAGRTIRLNPNRIHVPPDLAARLPQRARERAEPPAFTARVRYGTRWEPWVVSVEP